MPKGFKWAKCMRTVSGEVRHNNPRASRANVKGQAERICGAIHAKAEGTYKGGKGRRRRR